LLRLIEMAVGVHPAREREQASCINGFPGGAQATSQGLDFSVQDANVRHKAVRGGDDFGIRNQQIVW
jgi:hypothetical protein